MPNCVHQTTGYKREELRYPQKWLAFPKISAASYDKGLGAEEIIPRKEIRMGEVTHRTLGLQFPPDFHRDPYCMGLTQKEDIEHKTRIANEMIHTYLEEGEGRGLNIRKPKKSYFDMGAIKKDTFSDKFIILNDHDYFSSFKDEFQRHRWDDNPPYQPKQESFIKGMEYDPVRGRVEIDVETAHYTYSDYPYMASPADKSAYVDPVDGYLGALESGHKRYELRKNLKSNLTIIIKSRAKPICNVLKNELTAIETLREMITEMEFRKYMKHGFILVRGSSGRVYQIFRDQDHTKVWEKGKVVEEVCVRIKRNLGVPPTDNVIAFRTMVLCCEKEFKKLGNVYKMAA